MQSTSKKHLGRMSKFCTEGKKINKASFPGIYILAGLTV